MKSKWLVLIFVASAALACGSKNNGKQSGRQGGNPSGPVGHAEPSGVNNAVVIQGDPGRPTGCVSNCEPGPGQVGPTYPGKGCVGSTSQVGCPPPGPLCGSSSIGCGPYDGPGQGPRGPIVVDCVFGKSGCGPIGPIPCDDRYNDHRCGRRNVMQDIGFDILCAVGDRFLNMNCDRFGVNVQIPLDGYDDYRRHPYYAAPVYADQPYGQQNNYQWNNGWTVDGQNQPRHYNLSAADLAVAASRGDLNYAGIQGGAVLCSNYPLNFTTQKIIAAGVGMGLVDANIIDGQYVDALDAQIRIRCGR